MNRMNDYTADIMFKHAVSFPDRKAFKHSKKLKNVVFLRGDVGSQISNAHMTQPAVRKRMENEILELGLDASGVERLRTSFLRNSKKMRKQFLAQ